MRTPALFDAKSIGILEFYGVSARTKDQCGYFSDRGGGGGKFFTIFFADVLYARPPPHLTAYDYQQSCLFF